MMDLVEGEYFLIKETNFQLYLEAIGTPKPEIDMMIRNPTTVKIRKITNAEFPNIFQWFIIENFGGFEKSYVIDTRADYYEITEVIGGSPATMNKFRFKIPNFLLQEKISNHFNAFIFRLFTLDGLHMKFEEKYYNVTALLKFQRL